MSEVDREVDTEVEAEVEAAVCRAAEVLAGADTIALACHVNPDGDALGSMLGLFHVLRADGRDVVASFPRPFQVAPHYRELPGLDLLSDPADFPAEPDVMVTFDCGSLGRLGELETSAKAAHELIDVTWLPVRDEGAWPPDVRTDIYLYPQLQAIRTIVDSREAADD